MRGDWEEIEDQQGIGETQHSYREREGKYEMRVSEDEKKDRGSNGR